MKKLSANLRGSVQNGVVSMGWSCVRNSAHWFAQMCNLPHLWCDPKPLTLYTDVRPLIDRRTETLYPYPYPKLLFLFRNINASEPQASALVSLTVDMILSYYFHNKMSIIVKEERTDDEGLEPAPKRRKLSRTNSRRQEVSQHWFLP